jgi:hypothetical protein
MVQWNWSLICTPRIQLVLFRSFSGAEVAAAKDLEYRLLQMVD